MNQIPLYIGRSIPIQKRIVLAAFLLVFSDVACQPAQAWFHKNTPKQTVEEKPKVILSDSEILKNSQISYLADGGFTGVKSYGVIISCVNGRISTLKSIHDPQRHEGPLRQRGSMDQMSYIHLWKSLQKHQALQAKNVPEPKIDIADEFTVEFEAKAGSAKNNFKVHGIGRPEACQQFAIKSLIDHAVQMQSFIGPRERLAFKY